MESVGGGHGFFSFPEHAYFPLRLVGVRGGIRAKLKADSLSCALS